MNIVFIITKRTHSTKKGKYIIISTAQLFLIARVIHKHHPVQQNTPQKRKFATTQRIFPQSYIFSPVVDSTNIQHGRHDAG